MILLTKQRLSIHTSKFHPQFISALHTLSTQASSWNTTASSLYQISSPPLCYLISIAYHYWWVSTPYDHTVSKVCHHNPLGYFFECHTKHIYEINFQNDFIFSFNSPLLFAPHYTPFDHTVSTAFVFSLDIHTHASFETVQP